MQFDRAKFKAVILYTCSRCDPSRLGAVKLHKVLYFLDMIHYAETGHAVTGSTYRKRPHGPTSDQLLPAIRELSRDGMLQVKEAIYFGFTKKEYVSLASADMSRLSKSEQELLDEIIEFVCLNNTAKTISQFSHQRPWEMVEFGEIIPYRSAYLLYPSEVSIEAVEWAEEEARRIDDSRKRPEKVVYTDGSVFRSRLRKASIG